jgi:uncharacterized damage-inducible protein DinB
MKPISRTVFLGMVLACAQFAADTAHGSVREIHEGELKSLESELVPLAEAMPADKYSFAPTGGEFKGARTFAQQISHIATVIYEVSAGVLGEKTPVSLGKTENGAESLKSKDQIVQYLKDSIAYSHKAMNSLTDANSLDLVPSPFGGTKPVPRDSLANIVIWHSYDHYGQAVVYLRLNGIVPPASRPQ